MSRMYRYAVIALFWIVAITTHWFAIEFLAPGTSLYVFAGDGVGTFITAGWRDQIFKIFAQFIPLLFAGGGTLWGFVREYDEAVYSGVRR